MVLRVWSTWNRRNATHHLRGQSHARSDSRRVSQRRLSTAPNGCFCATVPDSDPKGPDRASYRRVEQTVTVRRIVIVVGLLVALGGTAGCSTSPSRSSLPVLQRRDSYSYGKGWHRRHHRYRSLCDDDHDIARGRTNGGHRHSLFYFRRGGQRSLHHPSDLDERYAPVGDLWTRA